MRRSIHGCWFLLALLALCAPALAQPKLVITSFASDLSGDGNTVVGSILDPNIYNQIMTFTVGSGFQARGPVSVGYDGSLKISDISGGAFFLSTGLPNGFYGSTYWPPSNPGLFGNYSAMRACCNGTTCTVMDKSHCVSPAYVLDDTSTCSATSCPATPPTSGGCCNALTGVCLYTTQAACTAPNYFIGGLLACGSYPCVHGQTLPFRYSSTTDTWTNCGGIPNNSGGTGLGAASCDSSIGTPYAMSSDGRFIVGGSWYGAFGTTACGTRGFICDANSGTVQMLPLIGTGAGCQNFSQAFGVSTSGGIVLGRDTHASTDPLGAPLSCNATCLAVWERDAASGNYLLPRTPRACCTGSSCTVVDAASCPAGSVALASTSCTPTTCPATAPATGACCNSASLNCTVTAQGACGSPNFWMGGAGCSPRNPCLPATEIILDQYGAGNLGGAVITRSGTTVAAPLSEGAATYDLSDSTLNGALCTYVRNASTGQWTRNVLGRVAGMSPGDAMYPYAISADGNTIVGASDSGTQFIWKPSLNGGVPMELGAYLQSINGGQPYPPTGSVSIGTAMSADGNALLVSWNPPAPAACSPNTGLQDLGRGGILYLNGSVVPCQPPVIAGGPYDAQEAEFTRYGIVGNVFVAGSYPMTLQWQRESPSFSNNWVDLQDSCGQFSFDNTWTYEGTHGFQLRVNELADPSVRDGRYRVVVTNSCGSATSAVANLSVLSGACCYYDSNSGGTVCALTQPTRCTQALAPFGVGGVYLGDNTACSPTACDPVVGACCVYNGSIVCVADVSTHCTAAFADGGYGGTFTSGGTACSPTVCNTVSGACCYSLDGVSSVVCSFELASHCAQDASVGGLGGVYAGNGTACVGGSGCPAGTVGIGACCFNATATTDIACAVQAMAHCTDASYNGGLQGKYLGDGVACGPSSCRPSTFGTGSGLGACCFTDPNNPASGPLCVIAYQPNCQNYPDGSNDNNTAPFNIGVGGNFYTNTCCMPSSTPPISGCSSSVDCGVAAGACFHTPVDSAGDPICTIQVRASRCTRPYNQGGLFGVFSAGTSCSPATLAANIGACCYQPDDQPCVVCTLEVQTRCVTVFNGGRGGVYVGNGTVCSPVPQCPATYGACCEGDNCVVLARADCTGAFMGLDSVTCETVGCPVPSTQPPPSGACCNTGNSTCSITTKAACAFSWIYSGACAPTNSCLQPGLGACCLVFGSCAQTCSAECESNGGAYRGDNVSCTPDPCGSTGICCRGATCAALTSAQCTVASGAAGAQFNSSGTCGTSTASPCCYADYNKLNGVSVQDIFSFLADWFAGSPYAHVGGDGSPHALAVQDIFDFLAAWFSGC